jgi:hypothetical protein
MFQQVDIEGLEQTPPMGHLDDQALLAVDIFQGLALVTGSKIVIAAGQAVLDPLQQLGLVDRMGRISQALDPQA